MYTIYCNSEKSFRFNIGDVVTKSCELLRRADTLKEAKVIYSRCIRKMMDVIDEYAKKGLTASVERAGNDIILHIENGMEDRRFYLIIRKHD